jgi:hypothetical protein
MTSKRFRVGTLNAGSPPWHNLDQEQTFKSEMDCCTMSRTSSTGHEAKAVVWQSDYGQVVVAFRLR